MPARGTTGQVTLVVRWFHPVPTGALRFRLRVHASADGRPTAVLTELTEPSSHARLRMLVEQDAPVDLAVGGPLAEQFHREILARGGEEVDRDDYARSFDGGVSAGTIIVVIAVIAAICIAVGFATFGAVLLIAMHKGYNIDNAGYQVAVGEGQNRQEHKMVFNIRQPES